MKDGTIRIIDSRGKVILYQPVKAHHNTVTINRQAIIGKGLFVIQLFNTVHTYAISSIQM